VALFHVPIPCLFHRSSGDFGFLTKVFLVKLAQDVTKTRHREPLSVNPRPLCMRWMNLLVTLIARCAVMHAST
jgi:hypothetical protein